MYAGATIGSSIILMALGHQIDHLPLRSYVYKTVGLLAASTLLLSLVVHPLMLPIALLGLRFSGQGLMTHISQTVLSRYYEEGRGKALSISSLGFSAGEMIFPLLVAVLTPILGWRMTGVVNGLLMVGILYPLLRSIPMEDYNGPAGTASKKPQWGIVKDRSFLRLLPSNIVLPLVNTAIFFYQLIFAGQRGWDPTWYSLIFASYGITRLIFGLVGGPMVDSLGAIKLYAIHHAPIVLGILLLGVSKAPWTGVAFLLLAGISLGLSGPIKAAVIAEVHGAENLGGNRAVYTAFMVFGTAFGPMIFGLFLDGGITFEVLFLASALILVLSLLPTLGIGRNVKNSRV